jgi:pyruvate ferredoxin oxidoreductase gamma subunit/2-oxoisovalerate ferredoxin oxidoreductase gamma subunit
VVVLDPTLLKTVPVAEGLSEEGTIIINSKDKPSETRKMLNSNKGNVWTVPATEIAIKILGLPITSTAMLGAVARATAIVSLKSIEKTVMERFRRDIAEKNFAVIREAYEEALSE